MHIKFYSRPVCNYNISDLVSFCVHMQAFIVVQAHPFPGPYVQDLGDFCDTREAGKVNFILNVWQKGDKALFKLQEASTYQDNSKCLLAGFRCHLFVPSVAKLQFDKSVLNKYNQLLDK